VPPSIRKGRSYTVFRDIDPTIAPMWLTDLITEGKPQSRRDPKNPQPHQPFEGTPQCDLDDLAEAMRFVPNDNLPWEEWANWGLAIFAASGGGQRGLEILDEFSRRSRSKYDANIVDLRWYEMTGSPPNRTGAEKIFAEARRNGWQPKLKAAPPTYASAEDDAGKGRDKMHEIVRGFLFAVDNPDDSWQDHSNEPPPPIAHAVRIDVGVGKTRITIEELAISLKNRTTKPAGPFIYATPRHNLNERIEQQFAEHGINARIYRGREADDPQRPGRAMCVNLPAVRLAQSCHADIAQTCCKHKKQSCSFFDHCGYQRQLRDRDGVQVWILAIDTLFHTQRALGDPIAAIVDEGLWQKGLRGVEANEGFDWSVAVDSISNKAPPPRTPDNISDYGERELNFLHLRHQLASALLAHPNHGGVEREHFDALSIDSTSCKDATEHRVEALHGRYQEARPASRHVRA